MRIVFAVLTLLALLAATADADAGCHVAYQQPVYHAAPAYASVVVQPVVVPLYSLTYLPVNVAPIAVTATAAISVTPTATVTTQAAAVTAAPAHDCKAELAALRKELGELRAALRSPAEALTAPLPPFALALQASCLGCHSHAQAQAKGGGFRLTDERSQLLDLGPAGWRRVARSVEGGDMPKGGVTLTADAKKALLEHAAAQQGGAR